jgi:hypothetical protein
VTGSTDNGPLIKAKNLDAVFRKAVAELDLSWKLKGQIG